MVYISTCIWRDLTDRHLYGKGDPFPYDGRQISEDRLQSLSGTQNKAGFAVIEAVETQTEETPAEEPKPAKRGRRTANKAE